MSHDPYQPPTWVDLTLEAEFPDLEKAMNEAPKYNDFYNRYGMLDDRATRRLMALPDADRRAILDEHHRRNVAIAEAWAERGEVLDRHDPKFEVKTTATNTQPIPDVTRDVMGTRQEAETRFMAACDRWIALRQPLMANAVAHKKRDANEHEARFQLANAAIHLAWFMRQEYRVAAMICPTAAQDAT